MGGQFGEGLGKTALITCMGSQLGQPGWWVLLAMWSFILKEANPGLFPVVPDQAPIAHVLFKSMFLSLLLLSTSQG